MDRKKKLKNAIILGLMLGSTACATAWAESLNIDNEKQTHEQLQHAFGNITEVAGVVGDKYFSEYNGLAQGYQKFTEYINPGQYDNINISVKNNYYYKTLDPENIKGDIAVGIMSTDENDVDLHAKNNATINVWTRNSRNAYGIMSNYTGKNVILSSELGNITINALKTNGVKNSGEIGAPDPEDIDYSLAHVYGISVENGGAVNLNAAAGIVITSGYDEEAAKSYADLLQGNIYGVSNYNGTVKLNAANGGVIVTANSADGIAYGIYTNSNQITEVNGTQNRITATADKYGEAYGIYAENGSKVNITGNTVVSGDNGAVIINGSDAENFAENASAQVIVDGDLTALAVNGTALTVQSNGSMYVTGNEYFNNTIQVSGNSQKVVDGSLIGSADADAIVIDKSTFNIGENLWTVSKNGIGLNIENSNVAVDGYVNITGQDTALRINNTGSETVTLGSTDSINHITSQSTALDLKNGMLTVNGRTQFNAKNEGSTAVKAEANTVLETGSVSAFAGRYGFKIDGSTVRINGENTINHIQSNDYRTNVNDSNNNFSNAVNADNGSQFIADGYGNELLAGDISNNYGTETALKVINGSEARLIAGSHGNLIAGAVYANSDKDKEQSEIVISAENGNNVINSAAHGTIVVNNGQTDNENTHLVSALVAEGNSHINVMSNGGTNYISSNFENMMDEESHHDSERTLWAYEGGRIDVQGNTIITASNSGVYTDGMKGNALGVAIAAGGRDLPEDGDGNPILNQVTDISQVNITYVDSADGAQSYIKGDVIAGYGGAVDINSDTSTTVSNASLRVEGNLLAANAGKLTVDFGKGGYWIGRADDYGDAGTIENYQDHQNFYDPAFSNTIIAGGELNVKMGEGSTWVLTGQSWLSSLEAEKSIIDMAGATTNNTALDTDHTHALVIGNFLGNDSTFIMDLDGAQIENSDMLYIKNNQGTFNVQLKEALKEEDLAAIKELRFATISGTNAGTSSVGSVIYSGNGFSTVEYNVKSEKYSSSDTDNAIYNEGESGSGVQTYANNASDGGSFENGKPGQDYINQMFKGDEKTQNLIITGIMSRSTSDVGQTIVNMSKVNYSNAIYMDRFNKRMGEARFIDGDEGVWVRARHDRIGKSDAFRSQNTMYEVGYDVKQANDGGENRLGFAFDYMDGDAEYSNIGGKGEIKRSGLWMYDSWMGDKGHYSDYVVKWGHLSNDFDIISPLGEKVTGNYSNNVLSFSAEYGRKKDIGGNWYFEPQAQLQYAYVTGADYMTSANTQVRVEGISSLISRAGFRIGKDLGTRSTVYVKADMLHEFLGDQDVYALDNSTGINGIHERYENKGTWYDVGFGFSAAMSKSSYAYLDFEKSFGNDNDETYQINAGMQWSF